MKAKKGSGNPAEGAINPKVSHQALKTRLRNSARGTPTPPPPLSSALTPTKVLISLRESSFSFFSSRLVSAPCLAYPRRAPWPLSHSAGVKSGQVDQPASLRMCARDLWERAHGKRVPRRGPRRNLREIRKREITLQAYGISGMKITRLPTKPITGLTLAGVTSRAEVTMNCRA